MVLISLSCFIALTRTSSIMLRVVTVDIFVSKPRGKALSLFTVEYNVSYRIFADDLYQVDEVFSIPTFLRVYIMNRY